MTTPAGRASNFSAQARRYVHPPVDVSRVVQRPVPRAQIENPRDFQLSQVHRRYSPEQKGDTVLVFDLKPSDPDFPYDIDGLDCALTVPLSYPSEKPRLRVRNQEMDRGYQINVERGFQRIAEENPNSTLLQLLNLLDKQLETLLGAPKAETIKLVANMGKRVVQQSVDQSAPTDMITPMASDAPEPKRSTHSAAQKADAAKVRDMETRQLEARLGRLPLFSKSSDGLTYTVPIDVRKKDSLPTTLHAVKSIKLHVPQLYKLEPCNMEIVGVEGEEALNVEAAFALRALEASHMSLMNHVNYLSANMAAMAKDIVAKTTTQRPTEEAADASVKDVAPAESPDKSHIVVIPRPPEWDLVDEGEAEDSYDSFSYDTGDETEDEEASGDVPRDEEAANQATSSNPERGIMMSFPFLELYGIELLELFSLSITVKCDRCKDTMDISNLKNNEKGDYTGVRSVSCKKCANVLGIGDLIVPSHSFHPLTRRRVSYGHDACQFCSCRLSRPRWLYRCRLASKVDRGINILFSGNRLTYCLQQLFADLLRMFQPPSGSWRCIRKRRFNSCNMPRMSPKNEYVRIRPRAPVWVTNSYR